MSKRSVKQILFDNFIIYTIVAIFLAFGGGLLGDLLVTLPIGLLKNANVIKGNPVLDIAVMYFATIGAWIVCLLWFLFKRNRYMYAELTPKKKGNNFLMYLLGLVIGFGMNAICVLIAVLHGDLSLKFDGINPLGLIIVAIAVYIQSSSEEVVCRDYLYQKLLHRYNMPVIAVVGNSVLFGFLHILNPGVSIIAIINIILIGVFFAMFVYYFDSLWCAFSIHAAWNYTQNIIFGLPNSGMVSPFSVFKITSANDSFAYNVDFGVEATITSLIVEIVGIVLVFFIGRKVKANRDKKALEAANSVSAVEA